MANVAPLVLLGSERLAGAVEASGLHGALPQSITDAAAEHVARLRSVVAATTDPEALAHDLQLDVEPAPLLAVASSIADGDAWVGVPLLSLRQVESFFAPDRQRRVEVDGLPTGFALWPVGGEVFALLPSDDDPSPTLAVTRITGLREVVELGREPLELPAGGGFESGNGSSSVRHCRLDVHRNRPDVMHLGMCVDIDDDPCPDGCYEEVRTIHGVPIAVDCCC